MFALVALPAAAQHSLEIVGLRHRTAEQVIPALTPLLEPGATLSGQSGQLFVRTSPRNLEEIRRALETIDTPQRRLLISVRFDEALDAASRGVEAAGRIASRDSRIEVRGQDGRSRASERIDQQVQALEGSRAMIYTGQSRPLRQRQFIQTPAGVVSQEVTVVQDLNTGFEVIPRVSGDTVTVEIAQQRVTRANSQGMQTAASGRLGEWFELGSVAMSRARDERGIASSAQVIGGETRRVWVKVDEIP
ncbi:MAG TPA: secretin N-terminal domain-containing protein [Burkholderiales bacterium]